MSSADKENKNSNFEGPFNIFRNMQTLFEVYRENLKKFGWSEDFFKDNAFPFSQNEYWAKLWSNNTHPSTVDETHRRNFEAMARAQNQAMKSSQKITQKQIEITNVIMNELSERFKKVLENPGLSRESYLAENSEVLAKNVESAIIGLKEISEIINQAHNQTLDIISQRFKEMVDDVNKQTSKMAGA